MDRGPLKLLADLGACDGCRKAKVRIMQIDESSDESCQGNANADLGHGSTIYHHQSSNHLTSIMAYYLRQNVIEVYLVAHAASSMALIHVSRDVERHP